MSLFGKPFYRQESQVTNDRHFAKYDQVSRTGKLWGGELTGVEVTLPAVMEGCLITSIYGVALSSRTVEKLVIPFGYTTLGDKVIVECKNLRELHLPESLSYFHKDSLKGIDERKITIHLYENNLINSVFSKINTTKIYSTPRLHRYLKKYNLMSKNYYEGVHHDFIRVVFRGFSEDTLMVLLSDVSNKGHSDLVQIFRLTGYGKVEPVDVNGMCLLRVNNASVRSAIYEYIAKKEYSI